MDFVIIKEKEELLSKRAEITQKKLDVMTQIKEIHITKDMGYNYNKGQLKPHIVQAVGEDKFILRNQLSKEQIRLERLTTYINERLSQIALLEDKEYSSGKIIKNVLKEIFNSEQFDKIMVEVNNRQLGLPPTKVNIGIDNSVNNKQLAQKYRDIAQVSLDALISVRKNITSVIDDGCNRFDKGYFLQCISPLNRAIPTLSELDKLKRNNHLN